MSQSSRFMTYSRQTKTPIIPFVTPTRPIIISRTSFTIGATKSVVNNVLTDNEGNQICLQRRQSSREEYIEGHQHQGDGPSRDAPRGREHRYYVEQRRSFESTEIRESRRNIIEGRNLEDDFNQAYRGMTEEPGLHRLQFSKN